MWSGSAVRTRSIASVSGLLVTAPLGKDGTTRVRQRLAADPLGCEIDLAADETNCVATGAPCRGHQSQRELTGGRLPLQPSAWWDSKKNPSAEWHEVLRGPVWLFPVRAQALPRGAGRRPAGLITANRSNHSALSLTGLPRPLAI